MCTKDEFYDVDNCIEQDIEERSLAKYGCTTPFGPNKTHICTDQALGKGALEVYRNVWKTLKTKCSINPCRVIYTRLMHGQDEPESTWMSRSRVIITLAENVKIMDEIPLYSLLSMVAEVGGYVGLFLGVSINQMSLVAGFLFEKIFTAYYNLTKPNK